MLERLAGEERVTAKSSRWIAALPFGAGQFQNGQNTLGWTFLISEGVFFGAAMTLFPFYLLALQDRSDARLQKDEFAAEQYKSRAEGIRIANLTLNGAFAFTAALGILQAQLAYVPERVEMKKRPIPSVGKLVLPFFAPLPKSPEATTRGSLDGAVFGLQGTF
jgi:hypothetical protein